MRFDNYLKEDHIIESLTNWVIIDRFKPSIEFVNEMFDTKHKITITIDKNGNFQTLFYVFDTPYFFHAIESSDNTWIVQFYSDIIDDSLHGNMKGSVYIGSVFSGIFQSVRMLINSRNAKVVAFTAEDNDLETLYKKMTPWLLKRFPKYTIDNSYLKKKIFMFKLKGK